MWRSSKGQGLPGTIAFTDKNENQPPPPKKKTPQSLQHLKNVMCQTETY